MLTGQEFETLLDGLVSAYPTRGALTRLLRFSLDIDVDHIAAPGNQRDVVFEVIEWAESRGRTLELTEAARQRNPGNPLLAQVALGAREAVPEAGGLELLINREVGFTDTAVFIERLGDAQERVGSVGVSGDHRGTCFLVGPDLVLTNYHVMKQVINQDAPPDSVRVTFGWMKDRDGRTVHGGTEYMLAADWLIDHSPYSNVDLQDYSPAVSPAEDELDYALIRLAEPAGDQRARAGNEEARGWMNLADHQPIPGAGALLVIFQHPCGKPLKLAWDTAIGANTNQTRLRYTVNTEPGSSGSPVFDRSMKLVALHHASEPLGIVDPCNTVYDPPDYNQGIPIGSVVDLIRSRTDALGV